MKLLFVVNEPGEFVELFRIASKAMLRDHEIIFYFTPTSYINARIDTFKCEEIGFKAFNHRDVLKVIEYDVDEKIDGSLDGGYTPFSVVASFADSAEGVKINSLKNPLKLVKARLSLAVQGFLKYFRSDSVNSYAKKLYKHLSPDIIIFGQEFPGSPNSVLTRLAENDGKKTLIIPFAVGTPKEINESLFDKKIYEVSASFKNIIAALLYPKWVNYYKGRLLLRQKGARILVLEKSGLSPPHPWVPNSSYVTKIAVGSHRDMQTYEKLLFPSSQLVLTGSSYDDALVEAKNKRQKTRKKIVEILGLDPSKPIILCAWPTDQYQSRHKNLEYSDYRMLCYSIAQSLLQVTKYSNYQIIIKPHPVTSSSFVDSIFGELNARRTPQDKLFPPISDWDTLDLVSTCDLYIACVSSTLNWAISLGIPAINYDCYQYGYTDFDNEGGTITASNNNCFRDTLYELCTNSKFFEKTKQAQIEASKNWFLGDGNSTNRIINLIEELLE